MRIDAKLVMAVSVFAGSAATGIVEAAAAKHTKVTSSAARRQLAPGLVVPTMDPVRGMHLFASKGCVVCHSINGVGGTDAPILDASTMARMMNPFEFFAKMWRRAVPMIAMQQHEICHQIEFTGQDLADIVAFVNYKHVQKSFSAADIPPAIKKHLRHDEDGSGNGEER